MESSGKPMHLQISRQAYELVYDRYELCADCLTPSFFLCSFLLLFLFCAFLLRIQSNTRRFEACLVFLKGKGDTEAYLLKDDLDQPLS